MYLLYLEPNNSQELLHGLTSARLARPRQTCPYLFSYGLSTAYFMLKYKITLNSSREGRETTKSFKTAANKKMHLLRNP